MKIAIAAALLALSASALAQDGYWENSSGEIWRNSSGECWRTSNWTPAKIIPGCDGMSAKPAARVAAPAVDDGAAARAQAERDAAAAEAAANRDTDGDGVRDAKDECPGSSKGAKVDRNGCYVVLKKAVTMAIDVKFPSGSARVDSAGDDEVKKLADFMKEYPQTTVEVSGHTDNTGNASNNRKLSKARADAVRSSLVNKFGIAGSRVSTQGYGPDKPLESNDTLSGRNANRRVEAVITQAAE